MGIKPRKKLVEWSIRERKRHSLASKRRKYRILSIIAASILVTVTLGMVVSFGVVAYYSKDLPSPDSLTTRVVPETTKIYSRDGVLLYEIFGDERRTFVKIEDVPNDLKNATIAVEDKDFYKHSGFDILGIIRGGWRTLRGEGLQGGSTITQQVVKNTLLTPERNITRKIKEFILSIQLERKYTKDEILQMYFNESPYGGQAWGVGAAAEMYFGKNVKDLTLAESTLIAGLPQAPSAYSPCGSNPENAKVRQKIVLSLMVNNGYLTKEQQQEITDTEIPVVCFGYSAKDIKAPHFVMYVRNYLTEMYGEKMVEQGGLRVTTTLDWATQQIAEEEAVKQIDALQKAKANATNAGVMVVDPKTGEILSMVGSVDYYDVEHDGNVNVMLSDQIQPGSAIKPIMYLTAFTQGYSPSTYVSDIKTCFSGGAGQPDYCPVNWDGKFWGPMSIRTALANSRNIPAVKMLQAVGIQNMIDLSHKMGITTLNEADRYGLSLTLGGGEVRPFDMAQAFAVIANMGQKTDLTPLLKVTDYRDKTLYEEKPASKEVVKSEYAYLVNDILSDSNARKTTFGNSLEIGRPLAVKTGTTNDNKDAWTIGYTPQRVTVVWVGNFNKEPMNGVMGSTGATPIMKGIMTRILKELPVEGWTKPAKVVERVVDNLSGLIPQENRGFPTRTEVFAKGSEPTRVDDFHLIVRVCKSDTSRLATQYHIDKGLAEEKAYTYLKEILDAWQPFTDTWMTERAAEGYGKPPTEKCEIAVDDQVVDGPVVQFVQPAEGTQSTTLTFPVEVRVYSSERVTKVEYYWDDVLIITSNSEPYTTNYDISKLSSQYKTAGVHKIVVSAYDSLGRKGTKEFPIELINPVGTILTTPTPTTTVVPTNLTPTPFPTQVVQTPKPTKPNPR